MTVRKKPKNGKGYTDSTGKQWHHIEADTAMVAFYRFVY